MGIEVILDEIIAKKELAEKEKQLDSFFSKKTSEFRGKIE